MNLFFQQIKPAWKDVARTIYKQDKEKYRKHNIEEDVKEVLSNPTSRQMINMYGITKEELTRAFTEIKSEVLAEYDKS